MTSESADCNPFRHILLASHGTTGAIAAENMALHVCAKAGTIDHLIVVPEFWRDMTGDDWLNNGITRDQFREYLHTDLGQEVDQHCDRLSRKVAAHALNYNRVVLFGRPDKVLLQYAKTKRYDLLVVGSPRPGGLPGIAGLRSTMLTKKLTHVIQTALLIVPYPKESEATDVSSEKID
ncbi:MAG: universal stress protein [Burkholderiales bacterium]|nr:universal stress protein [Nitrosomonas sp.]MCP5276232.1 universal stress protein [Burkholderiales bacterium]